MENDAGRGDSTHSGGGGGHGGGGGDAGGGGHGGGGDGGTDAELQCPTEREDIAAKIADRALLEANPDKVKRVVINMRSSLLPEIPACAEPAPDGSCPERDAALVKRMHDQDRRVLCVRPDLYPLLQSKMWFEAPSFTSDGWPMQNLLSFAETMLWSQIQDVAAHPFVESITILPNDIPGTEECPTELDDPTGKVAGTVAAGGVRQWANVDLFIPLTEPLCDAADCVALRQYWYTMHPLMARERTCVFQKIKEVVGELPLLEGGALGGNLGDLENPRDKYVTGIAAALTVDEAARLAEHPYVSQVWLVDAPLPVVEHEPADTHPGPCPSDRESGDGKIVGAAEFAASSDPRLVIVQVTGGAHPYAIECPTDGSAGCPERDAAFATWRAQNLESQRCVRAELDTLGGMVLPETFELINAFTAMLTWEQAQALATHPHLLRIELVTPVEPPGVSP